MFDRRDRHFEQQFRWEEDRWVFRFHQGGLPVVVSEQEYRRLVAEHVRRRRLANRVFFGMIFVLFAALSSSRSLGLPQWVVLASIIVLPAAIRITLGRWADEMLTRRLRSRPVVGEALGIAGRFKMRAETSRWTDLGLQLAVVMVYSFGLPYRVHAGMKLIIAAGWLLVVSRILIKWTGERRQLRGARWNSLARRAQFLSSDGENGGR